ncbi:MAG: hypothetical protein KKH28_00765, partial [Elusimicrobia bacterium]|nr:hypothetical protein [Elusimicrobiota bacterium]
IFFTVAAIAVLFVLLLSLCVHLITGVEYFYVLRVFTCFGIPFVLLIAFGAAHTIKAVTVSMTFQDRKAFLSRLNVVLAEIGYHPESQTESFLTYKPVRKFQLFDVNISVQIDDNSSTIVGPNAYIKKLQKWL